MSMFSPRAETRTVVAITAVTLLSLISAPRFYNFHRHAARGRAFCQLLGNRDWAKTPSYEQERIIRLATQTGTEGGLLMLLGTYCPISLLVLVSVCLISRSASDGFRRFLRWSFLIVSVLGALFLSLAVSRCGGNSSFVESFTIASVFYLIADLVLWSVIAVLSRNREGKRCEAEGSLSSA